MNAEREIVRIERSILVWARTSLGLTIQEVATKLDKDKKTILQWEYGKSLPTLAQLEKLAYGVYKRPLAVFFLSKPPLETTPRQDFRTLPEKAITNLSPELRLFFRRAKHHQLVLKQINDGKNPLPKLIHKEFRLRTSSHPENTAKKVRDYLGITKQLQQGFKSSEEAFKHYRDIVEQTGVYLFQYPLQEVRGFSLMDKEFPVIVINSSDRPNGKIFTLFHELCHILFNTGGVFGDTYSQEFKKNPNQIEVFCNQFASDVLLPGSELIAEERVLENVNNKEWTEEALQEIAEKYKVSKEVVLRKLLDLGKTSQSYYNRLRSKWNEKYEKDKTANKKKQSGGNYHATNLSHLGKNYVTQILATFHSGKLTPLQVADFLNIRVNRIKDYEKLVF